MTRPTHSLATRHSDGWLAPTAVGPVDAVLQLPGSKSLTNRALVLAALADAPSTLHRPLHSRDSAIMVAGLEALGAAISEVDGDGAFGADLAVTPILTVGARQVGGVSIDCGLAGTAMRFLPIVAALGDGPVRFDGDPAARIRPMRTTIDSLRALGVRVEDDDRGALPFTVFGDGGIEGGELTIDASASSQFVSALLLAAARFRRGLTLRHEGSRLPSLPHIEMTMQALRERGVEASSPAPGVWHVASGTIGAIDTAIEPDLSNAAPFLAAALVTRGRVTIDGWPASTTQVGALVPEILEQFGAAASFADGSCTVDAGSAQLPSELSLDLAHAGELVPTIAALATTIGVRTTLRSIGHIRGHETDRVQAIIDDVAAVGGAAEAIGDDLLIAARARHGGDWRAFEDHRMATSGAIVGLAVPDVIIDDIAATSKTIPQFADIWQSMLGQR